MKENKQQFRIGELARKLNIERFVIRFWEKEFGLKAYRSEGGQRYYAQKDLERFQHIKTLLYEKGLTIAGAKKALSLNSHTYLSDPKHTEKLPTEATERKKKLTSHAIHEQLAQLKKQLLTLKKLL